MRRKNMPEINITVESLAKAINHLDKKSLEQLFMLLSREGKELLKRKKDIQNKKTGTLSRSETFDV
jgi:hypothetical protein